MWLNQLFIETPINFEKRCRNRMILGILIAALGAVTLLLPIITERLPVLCLEPGWKEHISGFYTGLGFGLLAAGLITAWNNRRYLKNPDLKKTRKTYETDERNRMLGLRCWAYTGYSMFLMLYIGIIVSGFLSFTAMKVLLAVGAIYSLLLLIFRRLLQKHM